MKRKYIFSLWVSLWCGIAFAGASPIDMLDSTAKQVIGALRAEKADLASNRTIVYQIVNRYLLPHVDVYGMSRSVLGRNTWMTATAQQRDNFTREFTKLVVRTYSGALAEYTDEDIRFSPLRGGDQGKQFVNVNSLIVRSQGKNIPLNYSLVWTGGQWKIYDMSVEGVSLLQSFRSQFAQELSQGSLDALIQKLTTHNIKKQ